MLYRQVSQQIRKISLTSKDYPRPKVPTIHHFEVKKQETTLLSSINMPLFKLDIFEFNQNVVSQRALKRIQKEHGENFNMLLTTWSSSDKKILIWKLTKTYREIIKDTIGLLGKQNIFYYLHYHYLPAFYCNQDVLIEQLIQILENQKCLNQFNLGKLADQAKNTNNLKNQNPLSNSKLIEEDNQRFPFEGTGNLCDILHKRMPTDVRYWLIQGGGYDKSYLNFRISCSYILYTNPERDVLYRDLKRIKDLGTNVFDFLEVMMIYSLFQQNIPLFQFFVAIGSLVSKNINLIFQLKKFFNQISNDEAKQEFYTKRFFKQFEYENIESQNLLDQIIQWIDLFTLIYEESYLSDSQVSSSQTQYPPLKKPTFM